MHVKYYHWGTLESNKSQSTKWEAVWLHVFWPLHSRNKSDKEFKAKMKTGASENICALARYIVSLILFSLCFPSIFFPAVVDTCH